jgi:hypothetical protein
MDISSTLTPIAGAPTYEVRRCHAGLVAIVEDECEWQARHSGSAPWSVPKMWLTRWHAIEQGTRQVSAETPSDGHLVSIVMRNINVRFSVSGGVMYDDGAIGGPPANVRIRGSLKLNVRFRTGQIYN